MPDAAPFLVLAPVVRGQKGEYRDLFQDMLKRGYLRAGPAWQIRIAPGGTCPECGVGPIAPSAWDGHSLYVAGDNTTINGVSCKGSVAALNPVTGGIRWQRCLADGPVPFHFPAPDYFGELLARDEVP